MRPFCLPFLIRWGEGRGEGPHGGSAQMRSMYAANCMLMNNPPSRIGHILLVAFGIGLTCITAIGADYQSAVLADNPLAYYPLNLAVDTGTTSTDLSGNANHGTLVNITNTVNNVVGPSPLITNAIRFDGLTTYI